MAKELECHVEGCQATIQRETEQAVLSQAEKHAEQSHPELPLDDAGVERIRSGIIDI